MRHLAAEVERPAYDHTAQANGIVHFGIGAFHRAHQAWYTDRAMDAGDRDWGIVGVSMRSADVAEQLNPQDGLYCVTERSGQAQLTRLIGAIDHVIVGAHARDAVVAALSGPATSIASFTVTEKGYCRAADGSLDFDLAGPGSLFAMVAEALRFRRDVAMPGLTLLSCDNLAENGQQLEALMEQYLDRHDPALIAWFRAECACPSTMVDRIVPATTEADRAELAALTGLEDHGAVFTEPFSQWVIEDRFAGPRPRWEAVGADLVADVRPYETAKLRMLNGAHSLLAYVGLARGHAFVHQAIADPAILPLVEALMQAEAAPTIAAASGQDLARYGADLIDRFANPALNHLLIQIAMDGSQKLPQRWLETLAINQQRGRQCPAILAGIAAWITHLRGRNGAIDDPRADVLSLAAHDEDAVDALFGAAGVLASQWQPTPADRAAIASRLMPAA